MTAPANPRRQRGTGSVHQRPNGSWCGQIDLGMQNGVRRRKTVYGTTQRDVQKKIRKLYQQLDEHGDLPTSDPTLAMWLHSWLQTVAARRLKPNTLRSYRTEVNQHIIPAIGHHKMSRLAVEHIDELHSYLIDTRGLSPTTAHNAHRVLSIALNDGIKRNKTPRNIASIVSAPAKAANERKGLTAPEAIRVLTAASADERLGARWLMAFLTGVRQGERLGMRWSLLDLDAGTADLSWGLQRVPWAHKCVPLGGEPACGAKTAKRCPQGHELGIPKGMAHKQLKGNLCLLRPKSDDSIRMVALLEPLRLALLARRDQVECERPSYKIDYDLVWCEPDGSPISPKDDWQAWCDVLAAAVVRHVTGHESRHTTATLLLEAGVDPTVIKDILGHSEMLVTEGYKHVNLALQRQALSEVGRRLALT